GAYGITKKTGAMDGDLKAMNLGGSWKFGFMVLMGQYHSYKQSSVNGLTNYMVGATFPIGAGTIKASYGKTDRKLASSEPSASQLGLGYTHDLSKRTTLYTHFSRVSNDAGLSYIAGTGGPAMTAGKDSTGYEFGIRHSF
ncbi:MAG: porin, partial [Rubrivivax sp.]